MDTIFKKYLVPIVQLFIDTKTVRFTIIVFKKKCKNKNNRDIQAFLYYSENLKEAKRWKMYWKNENENNLKTRDKKSIWNIILFFILFVITAIIK